MKTTTLTLTALPAYAWIGRQDRTLDGHPRDSALHRAAPLALVTDTQVGAALCGYRFSRDQTWWRVQPEAVAVALRHDQPLWELCGGCLYLGGWPT